MRCPSFLALCALLAPAAHAQATLDVPASYPTIQSALDAAAPGDTVKVAQGVYFEHLVLREDVSLEGSGVRHTILDGGGVGDVITADGVHKFSIDGLTIRGAKTVGGNVGAGVLINGAACCTFGVTALIRNCRILRNGDGIRVTNVHAGTLTIEGNVIDSNARHAITLHTGTTLIVQNTLIANGGSGIVATLGSGSVSAHSNLIAFQGEYGVLRQALTPMTFAYNDTFGNAGGDYKELVSGQPFTFLPLPGTSELHVDPIIFSLENGDYHLQPGSPLIGAGNPALGPDFDGSAPEIGAYVFVDWYQPASKNHGVGCGPTAGWFGEPILGLDYFEAQVREAPALAPAVLAVGFSQTSWQGLPLPLALDFLGAPGCSLLTGPVITMAAVTDADGEAAKFLPLPADPVLIGSTLHHQWLAASPSANPLGLVFSDAVASILLP